MGKIGGMFRKPTMEQYNSFIDDVANEANEVGKLIRITQSKDFSAFNDIATGLYNELLDVAKNGELSASELRKRFTSKEALKCVVMFDIFNAKIEEKKQTFNKLNQELSDLHKKRAELARKSA